MKIEIEISEKVSCEMPASFMAKVAEETIRKSSVDFSGKNLVAISMASVPSSEIRALNDQYRGRDKVTDILSFAEYESGSEIESEDGEELFLGEIVLCCSQIRKAAEEGSFSFSEQLAYVISHGILHLLGVSHSEKMFSIQEEVADTILRRKKIKNEEQLA